MFAVRAIAVPLMFVIVACCGCVPGCPQNVTAITFTIDEPEPVEEFAYAPVVMQGNTLRYAPTYSKIRDAPGYRQEETTIDDPENLWTGWETTGVSQYDRVGIIVMKRNIPEGGVAIPRIYWFSEADRLASGDRVVNVPKLDSLPILETQPVK